MSDLAPVLLRLDEVVKLTGVPERTLYDWISQGLFPRSVMLGPRARGWRRDDVDRWIKARPINGGEK